MRMLVLAENVHLFEIEFRTIDAPRDRQSRGVVLITPSTFSIVQPYTGLSYVCVFRSFGQIRSGINGEIPCQFTTKQQSFENAACVCLVKYAA
jgi:hypothetical protein